MKPSYQPWTPEPYQLRGSDHLQERGAAVLWLDPGMRKTSIVLHAFCALQDGGHVRKMLVIAPKRVCELVWRQEAAKWEEFRHLSLVFLHGPKKQKLLAEQADIYLINPEGVTWLAKQYAGKPGAWPFDIVTFDELTKFKNSQAERSKALRGKMVQGRKLPNLLALAARRWGMTGTPNPNGYMDLFGQFLVLDDGAALGKFVTHYRDSYFSVSFNGFDYDLQPGAERRIQTRLEPYVFALNADDYLTLPELMDDLIEIQLEPEALAAYEAMRKTMVAELPDGVVEAANTAAAYTKLSQMAGGAVYMADGSVQVIHTAKLDALADLIDELQGQQMLIGYEFTHEKDRLKARFGDRMAFLADARTAAQADQMQRDWNAGRLQLLAAHPASAGHGLNLQESNARHMCWFGPIWDLELWDQFIRRLRRSGNTASSIVRHMMVVRNSIDELKLQAIAEKDMSQGRLKRALTTVLSGAETQIRSQDMVMKLQRAGAATAAAPSEAPERRAPAGWGKAANAPAANEPDAAPAADTAERKAPSGWGRPGAAANEAPTQREEIREKLSPEQVDTAEEGGSGAFSNDVQTLKSQVEAGESPLPDGAVPSAASAPRASRTRAAPASSPPASGLSVGDIRETVLAAVHDAMSRSQLGNSEGMEAAQSANREEQQFSNMFYLAAAAADAVAKVGSVNPDAGAEVYEMLFGAIEKRMVEQGYATAA